VTARVVSLVPSITETVLAWGADVVACTRFCEQPDLRHVGGTKNPDIADIVGLSPDVVLMDAEENRREDHDRLVGEGLRVVVTRVRSLDDVAPTLRVLADAVGTCVRPTEPMPPAVVSIRRSTALVPIWRRPWMAIGRATYGASVLAHLGVDVIPEGDDPYPTVEPGSMDRADRVLVPSEPYEFSDAHLGELARAMPGAEVLRVDGKDLFWWGVRTPGALERLAVALG
jgi:ABC-type Fe3+-hydroxamate transport system substrate-binding protein